MNIKISKFILLFSILALASCARRGTITGGKKDTLAPILVNSLPKNLSTDFNGKEIKLNFNEYVKLKDVTKQLIVSPPMKNQPDISPLNASKTITIKIKDTLKPNTTYSFNFGNSIEDNNEGNKYKQFKYVFSTGKQIDSLKLNATIKDALEQKVDNFVTIMLYEVDDKYTDSIIYKEVPRYVTNTLDSLKTVTIENVKQGKYRLIALKDKNNNNKYDPKIDKIGFQKDFIKMPNDTLYQLDLFKEKTPFNVTKVAQASGSKLILAYQGNSKGTKVEVKRAGEILPHKLTKFQGKDSLQIWVKMAKTDSLNVSVFNEKFDKTFGLKIKDQKKDSLNFKSVQDNVLPLRDKFTVASTVPLVDFDNSKMSLLNKSKKEVKYTTEYDEMQQELKFVFDKEPSQKYKLTILPKSLTDFYGRTNKDTLKYNFETKELSEYGNLKVKLERVKRFPVIVQLTDDKGKVMYETFSDKATEVNFDLIEPNKYTLRLIYDDNKNQLWDPGNFIEQRQSEEVIYFSNELDVRNNWDVEQPFDLGL